jgi:8-hydroxy-5-deazaflavin:NADPH oxidoreductase
MSAISPEGSFFMKVGVIGAGQVALAIARNLLAQRHEVALSSRRGPSGLAETIAALGGGAKAVSVQEAATAEIVILAVPWSEAERVLTALPPWNGRILIDTTNPFVAGPQKLVVADLGGRSSSAIVAEHASGARVVKAFNSILMMNFEKGPTRDGARRVLFVSGDDPSAKNVVRGLIEAFGYAVIDLGGLEGGGRMQQGDGPLAGKDLLMLSDWSLDG